MQLFCFCYINFIFLCKMFSVFVFYTYIYIYYCSRCRSSMYTSLPKLLHAEIHTHILAIRMINLEPFQKNADSERCLVVYENGCNQLSPGTRVYWCTWLGWFGALTEYIGGTFFLHFTLTWFPCFHFAAFYNIIAL